jgi:hypothetical protein
VKGFSHAGAVDDSSLLARQPCRDRSIRCVPALLRRVADALDEYGPIYVQDLVMGTEITAEGYVHHITVYFNPDSCDEASSSKD